MANIENNLIVYAPDGHIYSLPPNVYMDPHLKADDDSTFAPQIWRELEKGVVVGKLRPDGSGVGGFCYLLNLPALQPPVVHGPQTLAENAAPADASAETSSSTKPK